MTMQEFIDKHNITCSVEPAESNPLLASDNKWVKEASHYLVKLRSYTEPRGLATMHVPYSTADVLSSLALDATSVHGGRDFEDWAEDWGYDPDSRKAERIYHTVCRQATALRRFLGPDAYNELLFTVDTD